MPRQPVDIRRFADRAAVTAECLKMMLVGLNDQQVERLGGPGCVGQGQRHKNQSHAQECPGKWPHTMGKAVNGRRANYSSALGRRVGTRFRPSGRAGVEGFFVSSCLASSLVFSWVEAGVVPLSVFVS